MLIEFTKLQNCSVGQIYVWTQIVPRVLLYIWSLLFGARVWQVNKPLMGFLLNLTKGASHANGDVYFTCLRRCNPLDGVMDKITHSTDEVRIEQIWKFWNYTNGRVADCVKFHKNKEIFKVWRSYYTVGSIFHRRCHLSCLFCHPKCLHKLSSIIFEY